jgi:hypothetical protein
LTCTIPLAITLTNVNEAPTSITISGSIPENSAGNTEAGTLSAVDPDAGNSFTYELVSSVDYPDNALFSIVGAKIKLKPGAALDFEQGSTRTVLVRAKDQGNLPCQQPVTITLTNVNEAPLSTALSPGIVAEKVAGATAGDLSTSDPDAGDTWTYALVDGTGAADNSQFTIQGQVVRLGAGIAADAAVQSVYHIRVRTTDAGGWWIETPMTITVDDRNEAPTAITFATGGSVAENSPGASLGTCSTQDPDAGDTFTYALVAGVGDAQNGLCEVQGAAVRLKPGVAIDFETLPTLSVRVRATDQGGLWVEQVLHVTVIDVNDAPTGLALSNNGFPENAPTAEVGTLIGADPDANATLAYSLVSGAGGADNGFFTIADAHRLVVKNTAADYETKATYSIRVRVSDGSLWFEQTFTLTVIDVNDAPTGLVVSNASFPENAPNAQVGVLTGSDPDAGATLTYHLVAGAGDTDFFTLVGGNTLVVDGTAADFETKPTYAVHARVSDGSLSFDRVLTIAVTDVNEAPTGLTLSNTTFPENATTAEVGRLSGVDVDAGATLTYALVDGEGAADNGFFTITNGNRLRVNGTAADVETRLAYAVRVRVSDGSLWFEKTFTLTVTDVPEAPTAITLTSQTVPENAVGVAVGLLQSIDPDTTPATFTYSLVAGAGDADNGSFEITAGGELRLRATVAADLETQASYTVRVQTSDGALTFAAPLTVTVTNVNEAPTGLAVSATAFPENAPGVEIGDLSATDPDAGDAARCSFALVPDQADNARFTISGGRLALVPGFAADREAQNTLEAAILVTDPGGLTYTRTLTLTVTNVNEPPTALRVTAGGLKEYLAGTAAGSVTLGVDDPDVGDVWTLAIVGGADQALVRVAGMTVRLVDGQQVAFDGKPSLAVVVRATDAGGLAVEQAVELPVIDRDNMPVFTGWNKGQIYYQYADGRSVLPADLVGNQGISLQDDAVRPGNGGDYGGISMVVSLVNANTTLGDELSCESYGSAVVRQADGGLMVGGVLVGQLVSGQVSSTSIALDLKPACSPDHLVILTRAFLFRTDGAAAANKSGREVGLAIHLERPTPTDTIPATSTLTVRINTNNRPPVIALTPVLLGRGESRPLAGVLKATDDHSVASGITYVVQMPPSRGSLLFRPEGAPTAAPVAAGGTFTQADVDRVGALVYQHGNGTEAADAILFHLRDADGLPSDPMVLSFTINQANFAPESATAGALAVPLVAVPGQPLHGTAVFTDADATIDAAGQRIPGPTGDLDFVTATAAPSGVDFSLDTSGIAFTQESLGGRTTVPWTARFPEAFAGQLVSLTISCTDRFGATASTTIDVQVIAIAADELRPQTSPPLSLVAAPVDSAGSEVLSLAFAGPSAFAGQTPTVTLQDGVPPGATASCSSLAADGTGNTVATVLLSLPHAALRPGLLCFTVVLTVRSGDGTARASGWQPLFIRIPPEAGHAAN